MSAMPYPRKAQFVHQLSFYAPPNVTQNSSTVLYIGCIHNTKYQWHLFYDTCWAEVLQRQINMLYWSHCILQTHWDHLHTM